MSITDTPTLSTGLEIATRVFDMMLKQVQTDDVQLLNALAASAAGLTGEGINVDTIA